MRKSLDSQIQHVQTIFSSIGVGEFKPQNSGDYYTVIRQWSYSSFGKYKPFCCIKKENLPSCDPAKLVGYHNSKHEK